MRREKQLKVLALIETGRYSCDAAGNIYSYCNNRGGLGPARLMKPSMGGNSGYYNSTLTVYGNDVIYLASHQFIYLFHKGEFDESLEINHIDGNKSNIAIDNLELLTPSGNKKHSYRIGLESQVGSKNASSKLNENQVVEIKKMISNGIMLKDIAKKFGVSGGCISLIKTGDRWAHV